MSLIDAGLLIFLTVCSLTSSHPFRGGIPPWVIRLCRHLGGKIPHIVGTPVCGLLFGRLIPPSPAVIVPLEAGHPAVSLLSPVLTRDRGPGHRPFDFNVVAYHVLQEVLRSNHIAVSFKPTRTAPKLRPVIPTVLLAGFDRPPHHSPRSDLPPLNSPILTQLVQPPQHRPLWSI